MVIAEDCTIEEFRKNGKLSVWAVLACQRNHIWNRDTLLTYYRDNGEFSRFTGIDQTTAIELLKFCKELESANSKLLSKGQLQSRLEYLETLSPAALQIFDGKLENLRRSLSMRTRNAIDEICPIFTAKNIIRCFLELDLEFNNILYAGKKTVGALELLCEALVQPFEDAGEPADLYAPGSNIDELRAIRKISDSADSACQSNEIGKVETLLTYYCDNVEPARLTENHRFNWIERQKFCKDFESANSKLLFKGKLQSLLENLDTLSPEARQRFDSKVEKLWLSLSSRAKKVINDICPIFTVKKIIHRFLELDLEFINIRNSGRKTVEELEILCEELVQSMEHARKPEVGYTRSSTIDELRELGEISRRAFTVCQRNHIGNLETLLKYYSDNAKLSPLIAIDSNSRIELQTFCKEFEAANPKLSPKGKLQLLLTDIETLPPEARRILDFKLEKLLLSLSTHTKKILNNLVDTLTAEKLIGCFWGLDLKFSVIPKAGVKTIRELESLFESIIQLNEEVRKPEVLYERHWEEFIGSMREVLGRPGAEVEIFLKENFWLLQTDSFPLVPFLELCIFKSGFIRAIDRRIIFAKLQLGGPGRSETLRALIREYNKNHIWRLKSDERAALFFWQPLKMLLDCLRIFGMTKNLVSMARSEKDIIFLDANSGIADGSTAFSGEFLVRIASMLSPEYVIHYSEKEKKSLLVHQDLDQLVDIGMMLGAFEKMLTTRVIRPFQIKTGHFVQQFLKVNSDDSEMLKRIQRCMEIIIPNLYGLAIDSDGTLEIPRNGKKLMWQYVKDMLENEGKPLHINVISERLALSGIKLRPGLIRARILRSADIFVLAAQRTYGLKSWQNAGMFLGGTITSIIEGYLEAESEPKHLLDIYRFVTRHRNTTTTSITSNLFAGHHKFQKFGNNFFGLSCKKYDYSHTGFVAAPGNWFLRVTQALFTGTDAVRVQDIIDYAGSRFNMKPVQVEFLLHGRVEKKEISILEDGTVRLV